MSAARGASGVQLVGVCWYRSASRSGHASCTRIETAESRPAERIKRGVAVARVDIIMPQMGESIAEGTLSKWLKKVGEEVKRDEPIFEISTDKVDAEIPASAAGVIAEILVKEGETVAVQTVVARLETEKGALAGGGRGEAGSGNAGSGKREAGRAGGPEDGGPARPAMPASGSSSGSPTPVPTAARQQPSAPAIAASHSGNGNSFE